MKLLARTLALATVLCGVALAAPSSARAQDKTGQMMLNLKLGPAIGVSNSATQFGLEFEFGYQLAKNAYLLFPLGLTFGGGATGIAVPVGFQYDIPFPGVKNFYIYPRLSLGYVGVFISGGASGHGFYLDPGFGVKYVLKGRFNFGFEPFRLPIAINDNGTGIQYHLKFYAGFNF